jgi:hypothetical protein
MGAFVGALAKMGAKKASGAIKAGADSMDKSGGGENGDMGRKIGQRVGGYMKRRKKPEAKGGPMKPANRKNMY